MDVFCIISVYECHNGVHKLEFINILFKSFQGFIRCQAKLYGNHYVSNIIFSDIFLSIIHSCKFRGMFMICLHTNCRLSNSKDQFIIAMKPKARYVHHTFATPSDILQDPSPQKFPEFYNNNSLCH